MTTYPDFPGYLIRRDSWQDGFDWLCGATVECAAGKKDAVHAYVRRAKMLAGASGFEGAVNALVDWSFDRGFGGIAICWMMLAADPSRPATFHRFMPALAYIVATDGFTKAQSRLKTWWDAAEGAYFNCEDLFELAAYLEREREGKEGLRPIGEHVPGFGRFRKSPLVPKDHVVVMPRAGDDDKLPMAWKDLRDQPLPLVVCEDARDVREALRAEYPHATREIDLLTQDLRDGKPAWIKPTIITGPPGVGKSRLIRRLAELISRNLYVYRFDATGSHDGTYAGSPKSWSNSQPCVPARAIMTSKIANPIVMVDEIEKCAESNHNGSLHNALLAFLDGETSSRYRDVALDADLDCSHVLHCATANFVDKLPSFLRDRYRVIRIPQPRMEHLASLAAQCMREIMLTEDRMADEPLADDELEVIGRAWKAEKFSLRKLQRLVATTLEVRDACARRH